MPKIFALLVGINDYPTPIKKLKGCVNDIENVSQFLIENKGTAELETFSLNDLSIQQFGDLQICQLLNQDATYDNIVNGFESFLQQAQKEDVVWFHFSGHGYEQKTAPELAHLVSHGKDQTLVCFPTDMNSLEKLHLADKEIAALLHNVGTLDENRNPKESPHIVVSFDSCHSGSGTRDFEMEEGFATRNLLAESEENNSITEIRERTLASYAGNYYQKRMETGTAIDIPLTKHIFLAACESAQLAGDRRLGGHFTLSLLQVLNDAGGQINYADLFVKTRTVLSQFKREQTPDFEPINNFNPYTQFLNGEVMGQPNEFEIELNEEANQWYIKCGAIHGLKLNSRNQNITIQTLAPASERVGEAIIQSVEPLKSAFDWVEMPDNINATDLRAVITHFLDSPFLVGLTGDANSIEELKEEWIDHQGLQWSTDEAEESEWLLEVKVENGFYNIIHRQRNIPVFKWLVERENSAVTVMDFLIKIAKWERILTLNNGDSQVQDWIDFEVDIMTMENNQQKLESFQTPELEILATQENSLLIPDKPGYLARGILPKVIVKHTEQKLYCYLLRFNENYAITSDVGQEVFDPNDPIIVPDENGQKTLKLWSHGWALRTEDKESTSWLKLLVTTEPIRFDYFLQSDLFGDKTVVLDVDRVEVPKISNAWFSRTVKLTMKRME